MLIPRYDENLKLWTESLRHGHAEGDTMEVSNMKGK
jgi:hypothetical protein